VKRIVAVILMVVLGAMALGWTVPSEDARPVPVGSDFFAIDVVIDSGNVGLGAYQVEITPQRGTSAQLVGIEGGEVGAFADPPAYDPAALHQTGGFDRVILAAFTTDRLVPVGQVRVARVHFHVDAGEDPRFSVKLVAAGGANATSIPATAHLAPVRMDTDVHNSRDDDREGAR